MLVWAEADTCGGDATLQKTVDAPIKYCSASQACLEIDVLSATKNAGQCWVPGTTCPVALSGNVAETCGNGANVHVTGHGCDFVAPRVASREQFTIKKSHPCIEEPVDPEFVYVSVSCNKPCGDIDTNGEYPNADATVVWMLKCGACEKK